MSNSLLEQIILKTAVEMMLGMINASQFAKCSQAEKDILNAARMIVEGQREVEYEIVRGNRGKETNHEV